MVKLYVKRIRDGKMTIEEVPKKMESQSRSYI